MSSLFRPVYDWALRQAEKPYAEWLLFFLAMTEPCLSPIPPDILLVPMALARRKKAFRLAIICIIGVFFGGIAGYLIGAAGMATVGRWVVDTYHLESAFQHFHDLFQRWGLLVVLCKGLIPILPIPLTFLVIASGMAHSNPIGFILTLVASQATRLMFEAWLANRFGAPIRHFIERHLTWVGVALMAIVGMFVAVAVR